MKTKTGNDEKDALNLMELRLRDVTNARECIIELYASTEENPDLDQDMMWFGSIFKIENIETKSDRHPKKHFIVTAKCNSKVDFEVFTDSSSEFRINLLN